MIGPHFPESVLLRVLPNDAIPQRQSMADILKRAEANGQIFYRRRSELETVKILLCGVRISLRERSR
jgi:hypothetical protein